MNLVVMKKKLRALVAMTTMIIMLKMIIIAITMIDDYSNNLNIHQIFKSFDFLFDKYLKKIMINKILILI